MSILFLRKHRIGGRQIEKIVPIDDVDHCARVAPGVLDVRANGCHSTTHACSESQPVWRLRESGCHNKPGGECSATARRRLGAVEFYTGRWRSDISTAVPVFRHQCGADDTQPGSSEHRERLRHTAKMVCRGLSLQFQRKVSTGCSGRSAARIELSQIGTTGVGAGRE